MRHHNWIFVSAILRLNVKEDALVANVMIETWEHGDEMVSLPVVSETHEIETDCAGRAYSRKILGSVWIFSFRTSADSQRRRLSPSLPRFESRDTLGMVSG